MRNHSSQGHKYVIEKDKLMIHQCLWNRSKEIDPNWNDTPLIHQQ